MYLNQASIDELRRLPGVGPKRAEAILVLRHRLGRFQGVEDLLACAAASSEPRGDDLDGNFRRDGDNPASSVSS